MSSKECVQYITEWVKNNPNVLPLNDYGVRLKADGCHWISDGTDPKSWKRMSKKKYDNVEYRLFRCDCSIFDSGASVLLEDRNGHITLSYGMIESFRNHPAVGVWVKDYCGIK